MNDLNRLMADLSRLGVNMTVTTNEDGSLRLTAKGQWDFDDVSGGFGMRGSGPEPAAPTIVLEPLDRLRSIARIADSVPRLLNLLHQYSFRIAVTPTVSASPVSYGVRDATREAIERDGSDVIHLTTGHTLFLYLDDAKPDRICVTLKEID